VCLRFTSPTEIAPELRGAHRHLVNTSLPAQGPQIAIFSKFKICIVPCLREQHLHVRVICIWSTIKAMGVDKREKGEGKDQDTALKDIHHLEISWREAKKGRVKKRSKAQQSVSTRKPGKRVLEGVEKRTGEVSSVKCC
jgi:hypothetical protein